MKFIKHAFGKLNEFNVKWSRVQNDLLNVNYAFKVCLFQWKFALLSLTSWWCDLFPLKVLCSVIYFYFKIDGLFDLVWVQIGLSKFLSNWINDQTYFLQNPEKDGNLTTLYTKYPLQINLI